MVRILAINLDRDTPFIIVEKQGKSVSIIKKGFLALEKDLSLKGIHRTVCEFSGSRFLYDDRFAGMDIGAIKDTLGDYIGKESEAAFRVQRISPSFVATVRESLFSSCLDKLDSAKLSPRLLTPQGLSFYYALREKQSNGFFSLNANGKTYLYLLENKSLLYYTENDVLNGILKRFPNIGNSPTPVTLESLGLGDSENAGLLALALYSDFEVNFLESVQIEKALEPVRMRRSRTIALLLSLPVLLTTGLLAYNVHEAEKEYSRVECDYNACCKRSEKVKELEKKALANFNDLIMLSGSSGNSSTTRMLLEITQCAPEKITLSSLEEERRGKNVSNPSFMITGVAKDIADVFEYESNLKKGPFKETRVMDTRKIQKESAETILFKINVK